MYATACGGSAGPISMQITVDATVTVICWAMYCARTVKLVAPNVAAGVPEISPVLVSNTSPAGSAGVIAQRVTTVVFVRVGVTGAIAGQALSVLGWLPTHSAGGLHHRDLICAGA